MCSRQVDTTLEYWYVVSKKSGRHLIGWRSPGEQTWMTTFRFIPEPISRTEEGAERLAALYRRVSNASEIEVVNSRKLLARLS